MNHYGELFDNNLEVIRSAVRYHCGKNGNLGREHIGNRVILKEQVKIPQTWAITRSKYSLPVGKWLLINDVHVPFHELKPLEATLQYAKDQKITGIFMNGDIWDVASLSFWPGIPRDFDKECAAFADFLDFIIQEFPDVKIVYKPGNHEYRLPRYFMSKAQDLSLSPLAQMETIMGFDARGIEFLDYFQIVMAGKLPIIHGNEVSNINKAVNPARGLFLRTKTNALCGHCHTTSQHSERDLMGKLISTWSVGCQCNLEPEYNPYGNNWCWGFAIIDIDKNGNFEVANHRILSNGKVV